MSDIFHLSSYDYILDEDLIAQYPAVPADTSRLLIRESDGSLRDGIFWELPDEIWDDRVMFFNNSEIIRSRIPLQWAVLRTIDGRERVFDGEIFFLERGEDDTVLKTMVYPGDYFPVGSTIQYKDMELQVNEIVYEWRMLMITSGQTVWEILEKYGQMPLPPYIEYDPTKESRYQTIFAEKRGSLAAPTASLHFTQQVLSGLREQNIEQHTITLHVGLGTFKNIYDEDIRDYVMHAERAEVPVSIFETIATRKLTSKTILAVGTTVTRTLESLPYLWPMVRDAVHCPQHVRDFWDRLSIVREDNPITSVSFSPNQDHIFFSSHLFIYGEYPFQVVDEIITNFHLPRSTLFILISTFLGIREAKRLYAHAIEQCYRFFSFGDAMYLKKSLTKKEF